MKKSWRKNKAISLLLIVALLFSMFPSIPQVQAAETTAVRNVTDEVVGVVGSQSVSLSLYQNGMYEGLVSTASGSSATIYVNGAEKGSTSWGETTQTSVYLRYNSVTGEVTNSISNTGVYKNYATWVGNFTGLDVGIVNWTPGDTNGDLSYLGGGIFAKTFTFTQLEADVALGDGGYKVAYNHDWGNGEVGDNGKVLLTVPAGSSSITVFADTNTGYITDSVNTSTILEKYSIIGTVREAGDNNWNPDYDGYDFRAISANLYLYEKEFATPATYEYKYYNRTAGQWDNGSNKSLTTTESNQRVLFLYDKSSGTIYDTVNNYDTIAQALGFPVSGGTDILADTFAAQPGGSAVWRVTGSLGSYDSWNISNTTSVMSHLVGEYYAKSMVLDAGDYEFKFTKNGSWNSAIGSDGIGDNSANFSLHLDEKTKVNFYLNDEMEGLNKVRTNLTSLESQGLQQYTPALEEGGWPRLVGDLQTELGESSDWAPGSSQLMFVDYYFNNTVYKLQRSLPKGAYECKVVFGSDWSGANYGDPTSSNGNLALKIVDGSADVAFTINNAAETKALSHDYKPKDSLYDGAIKTSALYYDSRDITYKKPFGAIKEESEDVTFRFAAEQNDAQLVKLELIDYNDVSRDFDMSVATVLDGKDYWEVTVPKETFSEIGVWSYKFIVIDGTAKYEYGDDASSGGTGAVSEDGQTPYDLTVYDDEYETPDWMKNAVVYQIFPDRFYDGDTSNNHAKDVEGSRGDEVQLFDGDEWSTLPENPRQSEEANKPYYPDATTDGVWSNEFYGGDIEGIREKLSYLQTLGVTAIYLNPVSWAASNHKYDATDYKHLDPMFGEPVYNTPGDSTSGLNYEATKEASDKVYSDFAEVCDELGIHLITDGVFNHVGDDSIYFDRYEKYPEIGAYEYWSRVWQKVEEDDVTQAEAETAVKNYYKSQINPSTGENYTDADFCYISWFDVGPDKVYDSVTGEFVRYAYEGWWGYDSLPVIKAVSAETTNLTNDSSATIAGEHEYNNVSYREEVIGYDLSTATDVTEAMQSANSQRWLYLGASGWRLDVAPDVSDDTWRQFRIAVKSAEGQTDINGNTIEDPVILGEEWGVATDYLLGDMFDSVMNYQFRAALQGFLVDGGDASALNEALEIIRENYPEEAWQAMLNLVDSHDTVRNITKIDNPTWEEENTQNAPDASERAIKLQALTAIFQLSYPGAPTIYYGDEVGVTGTKDPDSRRTFPWERVTEQTDGTYEISDAYADTYGDLFNAYVKAAEVRNAHLDLFATGEIKTAYAEGDVIAYARKSSEEGGLSLINRSDAAIDITADVTDFLPEGLTLADELGSGITGTVVNGTITLHVPAYTGLMMVSTTQLSALPAAPANVTAEASVGTTPQVSLHWDAVEGADGYYVYRTLLEGTEAVRLNSTPVTETSYVDTSVTNGTRYYYYVRSVVDESLSVSSSVVSALPSFEITEVTAPSSVNEVTIGVGKKTDTINVKITVNGLTDDSAYAGREISSISATLGYYLQGSDKASAQFTKLRYLADDGTGKIYTASFEPTVEGTYLYFAKVSVNNGYTYTESLQTSMSAVGNFTLPAPATPALEQPVQESSRVTLNWSVESEDNLSGFEIYRTKLGSENAYEERIAVLDASALTYTDFLVSNDTTYSYRVAAYNSEYNRSTSAIVTVTPKLTMIEVTVRLHIPDKVMPASTDSIYMASDKNGWNASGWLLKKPSGATDNNIVEYTFQIMAGKKIEYKYTRGTWATEALTSNIEGDTTSPGNYGYSSTDTNIRVTVTNQGGNRMLIEDYVLRWVDMPIMITVPRISYYGGTIEYTTTDSSFNLQASVPYGGIFTINGTDINTMQAGALDAYGNVRLNNIPLTVGVNEFVLHIEPTQETREQSWLTDTGRITTQMTASTTIRITRTQASDPGNGGNTDNGNNGNNNGNQNGGDTDTDTGDTDTGNNEGTGDNDSNTKEPVLNGQSVSGWDDILTELNKLVTDLKDGEEAPRVTISMNGASGIPGNILSEVAGKNIDLVLDYGDYTWTINGASIESGDGIVDIYDLSVGDVTNSKVTAGIDKATEEALKASGLKNNNIQIRQLEIAYSGTLPFTANLTLTVPSKYIGKYIFLSYYNEVTKKIKVTAYGVVGEDGKVTLTFKHASSYVLTSINPVLPSVIEKRTIKVGKTYILKPSNALEGAKVTYSLSKKGIVTISKTGKITAKKAGTVTVTTTVVQAGKKYVYKTKITVKK